MRSFWVWASRLVFQSQFVGLGITISISTGAITWLVPQLWVSIRVLTINQRISFEDLFTNPCSRSEFLFTNQRFSFGAFIQLASQTLGFVSFGVNQRGLVRRCYNKTKRSLVRSYRLGRGIWFGLYLHGLLMGLVRRPVYKAS